MLRKVSFLILLFFLLITVIPLSSGCRSQSANGSIATFADLETARIGVVIGTTGEQLSKKRFPKAKIMSFDDTTGAVAALLSGNLDAILTGYPTAFNITRNNPGLSYIPQSVADEDTCVAVRKGDKELLDAVNKVISSLQKDGTLDKMKERWFKSGSAPYEIIDLPVPAEGKILKIGISATREPVSFLDENGKFIGLDSELSQHIAIALGRPVEFIDMNFSALIPALQSGKIDLIVTNMSSTPERSLSVDFSQPYFENSQVFTISNSGKSKGLGLSVLKDLADKRIGVYSGTFHDKLVQSFPDAKIFRYNSNTDMVLALKGLKIDAAFFDLFTARAILKNNDDLAIMTDDAMNVPLGIGFSKKNPDLKMRFNKFLKEAQNNGVIAEMQKRWVENDPELSSMPVFEFPQGSKKIIFGVAVNDLPYVAYMNNRYVGYDIELVSRFAQNENLNLEIIQMEFASLISALASGKVDMIADGIAITEERTKQVDFSDKYFESKTAVVALKSNLASYSSSNTGTGSTTFFKWIKNSFERNIIFEKRYLLIIDGLKTTALISILSCIFGTLLGGLICFMSMSRRAVLRIIARTYVSILRGIPALVLLMLIFYVVFASLNINPVIVAMIAFGLNFAAYVSEMFRTAILSIDRGQYEAGIAGGFSKPATFLYIILPQATRQVMPVYKGEFISMVKMTSVVGYIAVQDLTKAGDIIRSRTFDAFFPIIMVAVLYYLISWLLGLFLDYLAYKTNPKAQRDRVKKRKKAVIQLNMAGEK